MAHNVETMAYSGETPWHGLGVKVAHDLTPEEMREAAGLDWDVIKIPTTYTFEKRKIVTGQQAVVRATDGQFLTTVSDKWAPVQNEDAFAFFNEFVDAGDMEMHTAGSLQDGKIVWVLAKVRESFTILGKDKIDSYLLFTNPFIYGKAVDIRFTPIRVVCNNTLNLSLSGRGDMNVKVNHCGEFDADLVKTTLGIASGKMEEYREIAEFLASKKFTDKTVKSYFGEIFPASGKKLKEGITSRNAELALEALHDQPGAEMGKGTWWSAFNGVTFLTDHILGHSDESRLVSSWYGVNRDKKIKALDKALDYAKAA